MFGQKLNIFFEIIHLYNDMKALMYQECGNTLVNVYVDLVVFTRIAGTS